MKESKEKFTYEERVIADKVAEDILTLDNKDDRRYFFLILIFLVCLIFLISSISFAVLKTYYNGTENNVIDVNVDVDDDTDTDDNNGNNDNKDNDSNKSDTNGVTSDDNGDKANNTNVNNTGNDNTSGSVLFSFNSGSNYINMKDVLPTKDDVGKVLMGNGEFFDFNVSTVINDKSNGRMYYEIALVPENNNTISQDDVRVYLTENNRAVSLFDDDVVNFSQLEISKYHKNGRVIYRNSVNNNSSINYIFRMWLSSNSKIDGVSRKFGCKVVVDAYYK